MTRSASLALLFVCLLPGCGNDNNSDGPKGPPVAPDAGAQPDAGSIPGPDLGQVGLDTGSAPLSSQVQSDKPRATSSVVPAADASQLAADNLAFGVDLHRQLGKQNSGNYIFSQTSISLALAMLYGGAANNTAVQMATALHFSLPPERLHPTFDALELALMAPSSDNGGKAFQLSIANSLWVQSGAVFLPSYLDLLAQDYGAGLFIEDFVHAYESARGDINTWVSDHTEQMIPELFPVGSITPDTRLVLANAVYFHGDWLFPFKGGSPKGTFHAATADVSVPMMSSEQSNASLWSGAGWNAASLTYAGGTTSMILLVPDAGTFTAFEQGITADSLTAMLSSTQVQTGMVTMPSFKFATPSSLDTTLKALGMTDAFTPNVADFSGIDSGRDLSVGTVIHKAVIAVDEKGTTAAAATGVTVGITSVITPPTKLLVVDRPFLFFIRHAQTGAILFQGRVTDPTQ